MGSRPATVIHSTACVDDPGVLGEGASVWHFSHIMAGATVGAGTNIGQNCFVAAGAVIGCDVKIQNNVSVYAGVEIEDFVFLGPSCVLTNIRTPRSEVSRRHLYEKTLIKRGATIGANATVVCGVTIGMYALIGAGAVVTKDVPDYAMILGVPGRRVGWVSRHGHRLAETGDDGIMACPESGLTYRLDGTGRLRCVELDERSPLPTSMRTGKAIRTSDN